MLEPNEKDNLIGELKDNQKEISDIKKELNVLNTQKESEYQKREETGKQISELIGKIKGLKRERDTFTQQVRENKQKRDILRARLTEKIELFKKADEEKQVALKKGNIKYGPEKLRDDIRRMESKIETEGMTFDKEQKMMKAIKELKKELGGLMEIDAVFKQARDLSKEIRQLKEEVEVCNINVRNFAGQSQVKHEEMLALSKQVDDLMAQEKEHKEAFQKLKDQFIETNSKLKDRLPQVNNLREKLDSDRAESRAKYKEEVEKGLKTKEERVKDKMKKGVKLTTEDLLVFQGMSSDDEEEPKPEKKPRKESKKEEKAAEKEEKAPAEPEDKVEAETPAAETKEQAGEPAAETESTGQEEKPGDN